VLDWEMLMRVICGFGVVGAPTIRPDLRWPKQLTARPKDDADRLVVEN